MEPTYKDEEFRMALFHDYLLGKLEAMQDEKAETMANIVPNFVTKQEIYQAVDKDMKTILNRWFKEGKIKVHKTIHAPIHDYIEYIKPQDNERL